jgi:hypothetical protein
MHDRGKPMLAQLALQKDLACSCLESLVVKKLVGEILNFTLQTNVLYCLITLLRMIQKSTSVAFAVHVLCTTVTRGHPRGVVLVASSMQSSVEVLATGLD